MNPQDCLLQRPDSSPGLVAGCCWRGLVPVSSTLELNPQAVVTSVHQQFFDHRASVWRSRLTFRTPALLEQKQTPAGCAGQLDSACGTCLDDNDAPQSNMI